MHLSSDGNPVYKEKAKAGRPPPGHLRKVRNLLPIPLGALAQTRDREADAQ
jgi:hypothetical protein